MELQVQMGRGALGLRWARHDGYRVLAYAEGGYSCQRLRGGYWLLFRDGESMPEEIERALCAALKIPYED